MEFIFWLSFILFYMFLFSNSSFFLFSIIVFPLFYHSSKDHSRYHLMWHSMYNQVIIKHLFSFCQPWYQDLSALKNHSEFLFCMITVSPNFQELCGSACFRVYDKVSSSSGCGYKLFIFSSYEYQEMGPVKWT